MLEVTPRRWTPGTTPGVNLYEKNIAMEEAQKANTAVILNTKIVAPPNAFLPRINKTSRALVQERERMSTAELGTTRKKWHTRLYNQGRRAHQADAFADIQYEELSVAEKSYLRSEHLERERGCEPQIELGKLRISVRLLSSVSVVDRKSTV